MSFIELILLAIGLSMDTFAVAVCAGLTIPESTSFKAIFKKMLIIGLYFGIFQALMPLIGYLTAGLFAEYAMTYSHWIAFILLCYIGGKMVYGSFKKENSADKEFSLKPANMLTLAVATSIDALAVGVSFAFLQVNIIPSVLIIGITTLLISMLGVKIGSLFGLRFKSKAEIAGGIILILIAIKILLEGLEIISF